MLVVDAQDDGGYVWTRRFDEKQRVALYAAATDDSDRRKNQTAPRAELLLLDQPVVTRVTSVLAFTLR